MKPNMSTNLISSGTTARQKSELAHARRDGGVQQQVESHYRSDIIEKVRRAGGTISVGDTTVRLAKQFGFCYGVERAIDLAYAAVRFSRIAACSLWEKLFITRRSIIRLPR
jgi:Penicillin tolerance protein